jgi:hypothetical protein
MSERVNHDREVSASHLEETAADHGYYEFLTDAVERLPVMAEGCRIAVNIPACQEEDRIYRSLHNMFINTSEMPKQLTTDGRPLDPELYEVNIFDNWAAKGTHDGTSEQVERFMRDYPDIPVRLIAAGLPDQQANVGFARRLLQDTVVMRSLRRPGQAEPLYIASEDADNEGFDAYALSTYINYLDEHPDAVGARMHMSMNLVTLSQVPHQFISHRMARLEAVLMQRAGKTGPCSQREIENGFCSRYLPPAGVGVAYTAGDMLKVGGYRDATHSEDLSLWLRLHAREIARGNGGLRLHTLPTNTITSPRRLLASYIADEAMYGPGADFTGLHDAIRQTEAEQVAMAKAKHSLELQRATTQDELNGAARYTLYRHATSDERWRSVSRLMLGLGFKTTDYEVQGKEPEVIVRHWSSVEDRILHYQPNRRMRQSMNIK